VQIWLAARCLDSADADPLGVHASFLRVKAMAVLWIILLTTVGLSLRAGVYGRRWKVVDSGARETGGTPWLMDACARTFILVLLSLLGLLALGVTYGNVLAGA
jgi:hypothetical protein